MASHPIFDKIRNSMKTCCSKSKYGPCIYCETITTSMTATGDKICPDCMPKYIEDITNTSDEKEDK